MLKALLFLACLGAAAAVAWMVFLPRLVERELRQVTGFDVRMKVLTANPFTGRVVVRGLTALNPPAYPERDFVQLTALRTDVNLFSWAFEDHVTIDDLDFDLGKVELVRLHDGKSNFGECSAAFNGPPVTQGPPPKRLKYLIRHLHVRLEELVVADYTGSKSQVKTYRLNIDQTYSNVTNPAQLLVPQVVNTLYAFGLHHDISQLLPGEFGVALADAIGGVSTIASKGKDLLKGVFDKLDHSSKP
jgi:hypothetical protein